MLRHIFTQLFIFLFRWFARWMIKENMNSQWYYLMFIAYMWEYEIWYVYVLWMYLQIVHEIVLVNQKLQNTEAG